MNRFRVTESGHYQIELAADLKYLGDIRAAVHSVCRHHMVPNKDDSGIVAELEHAATELATAVILHGFVDQPLRRISLVISVIDGIFMLDLMHDGMLLDCEPTEIIGIDAIQDHRMDLGLIQQYVDHLSDSPTRDGACHIHLSRRLCTRPSHARP